MRAFNKIQEARSALEPEPCPQTKVDVMQAGLVQMMDSADRYERSSERTRRELAIQIGAHETLVSVVSRMEKLDEIIPEILDVPGA